MKKIFALFFLLSSLGALAGSKYKITVSAPQLKNQPLVLGNYFYGGLYARDSIVLDNSGKGTFSQEKTLPKGMYIILVNSSKYFDLVVDDDQTFDVMIRDTADIAHHVTFSGAEQTEAFQAYGNFISQKREQSTALYKQFEATKDSALFQKMMAINEEVLGYQKDMIEKHKGTTAGVILKTLQNVPTPEFSEIANDSLRRMTRYYYFKNHFFDNFDLADQRLLYTPFLKQRVNTYLTETIAQVPDTIAAESVKLIEKAKGDTLTFRNMVGELLNHAVQSKQMGMDRVTYEIATRYYLADKTPWADSTLLADLNREVRKVKYNMLGMTAQDLKLQTFDGKPMTLFGVKGKLVVLFLFEPSCGHCRKETPELYTLYQEYKNKGLEIVATYIGEDKEEWRKFIKEEHQFSDWINAWDPKRESWFWTYYDTSTTPGLYVLDASHKIIAKRIDPDNLRIVLENELK